jgi:hypothetical protein
MNDISSVVCAFLNAAVPLNVVKSLALSGICFVADGDAFFCIIGPEKARRLIVPLPLSFVDISDPPSKDSDAEELRMFVEDCTNLICNFASDDGQ